MKRLHLLSFAVAGCAGCFMQPTDVDYDDGDPYEDPTLRDSAEYDALATQLDNGRTKFLGEEADELSAEKQRLYWLEFPGFDPTLHSYNGARVDYGFGIGTGDEYNFRASPTLVVTAEHNGENIDYFAFAAGAPQQSLGVTTFAAPQDGQRWYAYAVDGDTAYIMLVNSPEANATTLMRWKPGSAPVEVTTLESAGVQPGEFWDFDVEGNAVLFVEAGRLWHLDLATNHAEWLGNETEVSGNINFEPDGVLFETATGPFFYRSDSHALVDIGAAIASAPYKINETYATAHLYQEGMTRYGEHAVYIGNSGVFAFGLTGNDVVPILLEPRSTELRVEYRMPQALTTGTLYVTALESESGSVGADGPVYAVDLNAALP